MMAATKKAPGFPPRPLARSGERSGEVVTRGPDHPAIAAYMPRRARLVHNQEMKSPGALGHSREKGLGPLSISKFSALVSATDADQIARGRDGQLASGAMVGGVGTLLFGLGGGHPHWAHQGNALRGGRVPRLPRESREAWAMQDRCGLSGSGVVIPQVDRTGGGGRGACEPFSSHI